MAIRSPLYGMFLGPSTPEQRKVALDSTRETLTQLRDLMRELDIPAQHLDLAVQIYAEQLAGLMADADQKRNKERRKKLREKLAQQQQQMGQIGQLGISQTIPMVPQPLSPLGLDDFFDDED